MAIALLEQLPECRVGHVGSVYVTVWFSELTVPAIDMLEKHHRALVAKHGTITLVSVVVNATAAPPAELRERMRAQSKDLAKGRRGNVVVVLARGLAAIITRTFLAALSLISVENMKVFKTLDEAATALRELPGQDAETKANLRFAEELADFVALPRVK